jgi:hypothetical protein
MLTKEFFTARAYSIQGGMDISAVRSAIDAAILVANCPVCHQTMALTARHLEAAGIPTVVVGAARDIVETCGVPRFVFSDVPLGSAAALPDDPASQDATLGLALSLLEQAFAPRTTVQSPMRWLRERVFTLRERLEAAGLPHGSMNGGTDAVPVLERAF